MYDKPMHLVNENGLSLLSGKGYGALVTREFFENVSQDTVEFASTVWVLSASVEMGKTVVKSRQESMTEAILRSA